MEGAMQKGSGALEETCEEELHVALELMILFATARL